MDAIRRALLVIDVQHEYIDGAMPVAFPQVAESLAAIEHAVRAAQAAALPVIVVRHDDGPGAEAFATDSPGAALAGVVADLDADAVVVKHGVSAFSATPLADLLADRRIDTLAIVGYLTHVCVESTARDAADRGFAVEVLGDATGSIDIGGADAETVQSTSLAVLGSAFAAVTTSADWEHAVRRTEPLAAPDLLSDARAARLGRDPHAR